MTNNKHKKSVILLSKLLVFISMFLCIALFLVYIIEPDFFAILTSWPVWIWGAFGAALILFGTGANIKYRLIVALMWALLIIFQSEEPLSILRGYRRSIRDCKNFCPTGNCLRVISLNCAGASTKAAEELVQFAPDIILLQESPSKKDLEALTQKLFSDGGEFVLEGDTAILARGRLTKTKIHHENHSLMTVARVSMPSGIEIEIASIHLSPPVTGINIFSPACWREHREDRQNRIKQIRAIRKHLDSTANDVPLVLGGDFNSKPWRGMKKLFSPRLNDSFDRSGIGWPGTGPVHFPLWRIDQIWISKHFTSIKVQSQKNENSDHRMVICDLCKL